MRSSGFVTTYPLCQYRPTPYLPICSYQRPNGEAMEAARNDRACRTGILLRSLSPVPRIATVVCHGKHTKMIAGDHVYEVVRDLAGLKLHGRLRHVAAGSLLLADRPPTPACIPGPRTSRGSASPKLGSRCRARPTPSDLTPTRPEPSVGRTPIADSRTTPNLAMVVVMYPRHPLLHHSDQGTARIWDGLGSRASTPLTDRKWHF